jgi:hypothetical protein
MFLACFQKNQVIVEGNRVKGRETEREGGEGR